MEALIETATIDEAISRSSNPTLFVRLLQSLGYSNSLIKHSIESFINTPSQLSEVEKIMTKSALKQLQQ